MLQAEATQPGSIEMIGKVTACERCWLAMKNDVCAIPHSIPVTSDGRKIDGGTTGRLPL